MIFIDMIFKITISTIKEITNIINLTIYSMFRTLSNNNFVIIISIHIYIFLTLFINSTQFLTMNKYLFIKLHYLLNVSNQSL